MERYLETLSNVSPLTVLLSAVAMIVVSTIWYSPLMFGKSVARLTDRPISGPANDQVMRGFVFASITSLFAAYLLGVAATHAAVHWSAMFASVAFLWLFIMLEQLNGVIWHRMPFALFLIHAFRSLFALSAGAAIYLFWS